MAFDLEQWKSEIRARLEGWKPRMQRAGVNSAYAALVAAALWPVAQAAQQGEWAALMALGSVLAGVGGNLVANQIQGWKDKNEAQIAQQLAELVAANPQARAALDELLEKLDVLQLAQERLSQDDRAWFTETLQAELAQLGSRLAAPQIVAQGSVVMGNVTVSGGDFISRDKIINNIYQGPPVSDPRQALAIYRQVVLGMTANLPMRGIDLGAADPESAQQPLGLTNIYINLDTTSQVKKEAKRGAQPAEPGRPDGAPRPLAALEAVIRSRSLVLLGDPGSGKSTFVNFLAYCLAAHALAPQQGWLEHLPGWPENEAELLPVLVLLRDFARGLPAALPDQAEPQHLWGFMEKRLEAQNLGFVGDALRQALEDGRVLLLLDGLDEVPGATQRLFVRRAVQAFMRRYPHCRYLVTCRVLSYQPPQQTGQADLRLAGLPVEQLAPFDADKIDRFVSAWYQELARLGSVGSEEAAGLAQRLQQALRRQDLWRLAPNPLLLTVMALVHTHKGRLPDARALLYEDTVDILLWRWEQIKSGGGAEAPRLRRLLLDAGRSEVDLKRVLWELAYQAHSQAQPGDGGEQLADIGELRLEKALADLKDGDRTWAAQMIEAMKLRAGLLLERAPEVFTFPHRTFQEYLAGGYLASQANFACCAAEHARQLAQWREVILLATGKLVYLLGDLDKPLALIGELCPAEIDIEDEQAWRQVWLAGDVLLEIGEKRARDSALGRDLLQRLRLRLAQLLEQGRLSPLERARAGAALGRLGDPRPEAVTLEGMQFCWVPGGPFKMGSRKKHDPQADKDESPQHELDLPGYWVGRGPVTQAQFAVFVQEGGYGEARYWKEAIQAKRWREGQVRRWNFVGGKIVDEWASHPYDYGLPYSLPNHPVVGVSWYEALAFTRWLTEYWREQGRLAQGWSVTLPSEAEWEKAARGGLRIPAQALLRAAQDGLGAVEPPPALQDNPLPERVYPWGDEFDPRWANSDASGISATSALGCFPGGAGPYGVLDLSGNVWEWTRTCWGKGYPYRPADGREDLAASDSVPRVLRGGSFGNYAPWSRCAARYFDLPYHRFDDFGFRVGVFLPIS